MRKVTEKAAIALKAQMPFSSGNTRVYQFHFDTAFWGMDLHNNKIAMYGANTLTLFDAGWQSATTKERLNGILDTFNLPYKIWQHDGVWYVRDQHGNNEKWDGKRTWNL